MKTSAHTSTSHDADEALEIFGDDVDASLEAADQALQRVKVAAASHDDSDEQTAPPRDIASLDDEIASAAEDFAEAPAPPLEEVLDEVFESPAVIARTSAPPPQHAPQQTRNIHAARPADTTANDDEPAETAESGMSTTDSAPALRPSRAAPPPANAALAPVFALLKRALLTLLVGLSLPLRAVPPAWRPYIDWIALSLVFWTPIVWLLAFLLSGT